MKRIMIDLDDVITEGGLKESILLFDKNITEEQLDNHKSYYMQELIKEEKLDEFWDFVLDKNMYDYGYLIKDAKEVIEELSNHYEIYICSSYIIRKFPDKSSRMLDQKFDWIRENLPFIKPSNIVFCSDKSIIDCEIKIDDKVSNLTGPGELKLLFSSYHNMHNITPEEMEEKGLVRVNNWLEIKELLLDTKK